MLNVILQDILNLNHRIIFAFEIVFWWFIMKLYPILMLVTYVGGVIYFMFVGWGIVYALVAPFILALVLMFIFVWLESVYRRAHKISHTRSAFEIEKFAIDKMTKARYALYMKLRGNKDV